MNAVTESEAPEQDRRLIEARRWAAQVLGTDDFRLEPVSGDASFRRYFRVRDCDQTLILMDAPPESENSEPFVDIARRLRSAGLNAPEIRSFDLELGFGLLQDFGDTLYRGLITETTADRLFPELFNVLDGMARRVDASGLPRYGETALAGELDLFRTWYLDRHRNRTMNPAELASWNDLCRALIESARSQPQVFVHKDFHSCNLLHTGSGPGIIDFQDGLLGPVSYDFASLVWDRYVAWPRERIENWMAEAFELLPLDCSFDEWVRWCDWMGLQRNLKIVGIFARLRYRDRKQGYIEMIPRFYQYLLDVTPRYPEFSDFQRMLELPECAP